MSYILDALRRADAERERGVVPGLQSQQHTIVDDDAAPPARSRPLVWAVGALSVALVAALAWNLLGGRATTPRAVAEGAVAPASPDAGAAAPAPVVAGTQNAPPGIAPATTMAPIVAVPSPNAATKAVAPTSPAAVSALPAAAPATTPTADRAEPRPSLGEPLQPRVAGATRPPRRHEETRRVARAGNATAVDATSPPTTARGTAPPVAAATAGTEARIYQPSELPEDVRRDLPKLAIGGSSYSGDASSRMLMINGQVFHEGDQLAPGLVLDRIKLKSAVLSYRGYRYEMTF